MPHFLTLLIEAILTIMLADFIAGIVHWAEDAYIRDDTPLVGLLLGKPNMIHHHLPRYMARHSWWHSSLDLLLLMSLLVITMKLTGHLTWHVWLFAVIGTNANQVHKWAHRSRTENGLSISFFQDIKVFQSPAHHAIHHTNPKEVRYCPVTNLVNPILDAISFWAIVEFLNRHLFGLKRRADSSIPGNGLVPTWLPEVRAQHASKFKE